MKGSGRGQDERLGQGQACRGHAPAEGAADKPRKWAGNQADQSGADTKPSPSNQEPTRSPWTPITTEPAFSSLYGRPPCRFAYPPPGVLPESDRPIKGPEQRSIGVVPSSCGVSYSYENTGRGKGLWSKEGHGGGLVFVLQSL